MTVVSPKVYLIIDMPTGAYLHYCVQLGNALARTGQCTVRVVSLFENRESPGIPEDERCMFDSGLELDIVGRTARSRSRRCWIFFMNFLRHLQQVRRDQASVVHVHTGTAWPWLDTGLLLVYRLLRIPIVRTIHELTTAERIGEATRIQQAIGILQVKLAQAIITHNQDERDRFVSLLGKPEVVAVVPHGNYLCFRSTQQSQERAMDRTEGPLRILFMGIKRHKGIEVFLEAMKHLMLLGAPVTATVIGRVNAGDEDLLERIRTLPNVLLEAGYVTNQDLEMWYRRHDLVALPYIRGTTSGAVHLAYAFDRPVIASDLPCFRELVIDGETGFVVRAGDAMALIQGIQRALSARFMLRRMGAAGFFNVSRPRYAWDRIAAQTLRVYYRAIAKSSGDVIPSSYLSVEGDDDVVSCNRDLAASRTSST